MTLDGLIRAVALRMDEITPDNGYIIPVDGSDNNPLYELIKGVIPDAVRNLYAVAPYWRLPQSSVTQDASHMALKTIFEGSAYEREKLRIKIGDDFLRLCEIKYTGFSRPITEVYPEQSEEARRQHNPYLVGKTAKPVAVLTYGSWGETSATSKEIDCYSLPQDASLTVANVLAYYIAKPAEIAATGESAVEAVVPAVLIPALEWLAASLAFSARGNANHSAICTQNAQNLLA